MRLADQSIPVYTNLTDLYGSLGSSVNHAERWDNLAKEFEKRFGRPPAYITRAPGRINIIGEHIDYALFGVLPAAIEQDILIACAPRQPSDNSQEIHERPGSVVADNLNSKYTRQVFAPSQRAPEGWHLEINTNELRWESYVKAGYYGVLSRYFPPDSNLHPTPVDLLATGSVPSGSGVSSSAAIVVASTLAFLAVNNKLTSGSTDAPLSKGELVKMAMENETRVGVNSGGMDQAASVMSVNSSALYITFFPILNTSPVPLPSGAKFVISNTLVVADKVVTAKFRYNLRVVETLVGARILAHKLGVKLDTMEKVTYREVLGRIVKEQQDCGSDGDMGAGSLIVALKSIMRSLTHLLPKGVDANAEGDERQMGLTMEEMIEMSGLSQQTFHEVYLSWIDVEATHFQLYKRAKHVFTEALRVLQFRKTSLDATDASPSLSLNPSTSLEKLGNLMNESQKSCRELFECSCPELDMLTKLCREAGAYGSRLTGAGWGGCAVSLVAEDQVEIFIKKIKDEYPPYKGLKEEQLNDVIFATKPGSGACGMRFLRFLRLLS
ncbi:hypothetical protein AGABI2DRAFT_65690 [Agaricus bisporus var. bisporus H97]|uniref:hypothetical protein n=1 Tax=Agaricus bisporus var. bisporus (strain H97 / ATCC MYA-4626 / FGSC 10389) TaxID=936046 RepID=UPI00029F5E4A|nr:hypothetical protein AGABI2DRAFT_65690 [Agaricus bisporus var. bisporus H97]EKV49555.1 hypothetical protein AGABI2DRAFT_65690 [Agaricus bisporus var. bisporus H97]